ncbi:MAG: UDP-3-O-(3-hydroxymyristoyl)glucosamine N-acyltransferase [Phycisphaerales bacterium]|nr:MAG: UDP-3-O-(3-hydroxymyristoyl)glucosamine N-acyltransferase [Phycisphaerales bacterium]
MTLQQLAQRIDATLDGDGSITVTGCAPIDRAGPGEVAFLANQKYARFLPTTRAAAVVVSPDVTCPPQLARLICDDPYYGFRNAVVALHGFRPHSKPLDKPTGSDCLISPAASVHPQATIAEGAILHPHAVVEAHASVGRDSILYPGAYVGPHARVGESCILYPNAVVYDRCVLGNRVTLHANTVVGHDGFGYATHEGIHHKIPQTGIVVIEDDVELGAGCAVERAAIGETRVGQGTKFADLISIGHGTTIGRGCLFVSLVGVSGSVEVGDYVVLGGQVGVTGHIKIGDGVQAAGKTAIASDIEPGRKVAGQPAVDLDQAKRNALAGRDLYDLVKRVRQLERELRHLREQSATDDATSA